MACTGLLWKAKGFDAQSWCVRWVDTFLICSSSGHNVHSSSTSCTASLLEAGMYVCAFACRYQGEVAPAKWKWPEQNAKEVEREWVCSLLIIMLSEEDQKATFHLLLSLSWSTYCLINDLQVYHFLWEIHFPESHYQWTRLQLHSLNCAVNAHPLRPGLGATAKFAVIGTHLLYLAFKFVGLGSGQYVVWDNSCFMFNFTFI